MIGNTNDQVVIWRTFNPRMPTVIAALISKTCAKY